MPSVAESAVIAVGAVALLALVSAILHLTVWSDAHAFVPRRLCKVQPAALTISGVRYLAQAADDPDVLDVVTQRLTCHLCRLAHVLHCFVYLRKPVGGHGYLEGVLDPAKSDVPDAVYEVLLAQAPAEIRVWKFPNRQSPPRRVYQLGPGDLFLFSKDPWTTVEWESEQALWRFAFGTCPMPRRTARLREERHLYNRRWSRRAGC